MSAIAPALPKLRKLLPMLGSDKDNEVIAAARAVQRVLNANGLDFHDLNNALVDRPVTVRPAAGGASTDRYWQHLSTTERDKTLVDLIIWPGLTDYEFGFCQQMLNRVRTYGPSPTAKQQAVLDRIIAKARREGLF